LILKNIRSRRKIRACAQALDFSGVKCLVRLAFNKVIHKMDGLVPNRCRIKDLEEFRKAQPKLCGVAAA
jgi:hypothetical protein